MNFEEWLDQASEEDLRVASAFTWHFPSTIKVYPTGNLDDEPVIEHVCGCDPGYSYQFGTGIHVPDRSMAVMYAIFVRCTLQEP